MDTFCVLLIPFEPKYSEMHKGYNHSTVRPFSTAAFSIIAALQDLILPHPALAWKRFLHKRFYNLPTIHNPLQLLCPLLAHIPRFFHFIQQFQLHQG
jgi:hypothetical protein